MVFTELSTPCLTEGVGPAIRFSSTMRKRTTPVHQSAMPLQKRINDGKFTKSQLAAKLDVRPQHVTNWLSRGIPSRRIQDVAALCGLNSDDYLREAGIESKHAAPKQQKLDSPALLQDFEVLPDGLRTHILRKTRELRDLYEALPVWLRDKLVPPKDPERYREWERDIEALVLKFARGPKE